VNTLEAIGYRVAIASSNIPGRSNDQRTIRWPHLGPQGVEHTHAAKSVGYVDVEIGQLQRQTPPDNTRIEAGCGLRPLLFSLSVVQRDCCRTVINRVLSTLQSRPTPPDNR